MVEQVFERLVLSILGGLIDRDCGEEGGAILGIVGSKRNRGDRCEIWVGGQNQKIAPTDAWLESVRSRVGQEVEVNVAKYKSVGALSVLTTLLSLSLLTNAFKSYSILVRSCSYSRIMKSFLFHRDWSPLLVLCYMRMLLLRTE